MLLPNRSMAVHPTPLGNRPSCPPEPAASRAPLHHPVALPRPCPVMREPQQVKSAWPRFLTGTRAVGPTWRPKGHQPGLIRVDRQAVLAETLRQHLQHSPGVFFPAEPHDEIVRVSND